MNFDARQPIETAPKDGTWFLAYRPPLAPGEGRWNTLLAVTWDEELDDFAWIDDVHDPYDPPDLAAWDDESGSYVYSPFEANGTLTHWMPLPTPPSAEPGEVL